MRQPCEVLHSLFKRLRYCVEEHNIAEASDDVIEVREATQDYDLLRVQRADGGVPPRDEHVLRDADQPPLRDLIPLRCRIAQLLNRVENVIVIGRTAENVDISVKAASAGSLSGDVHLRHLLPPLVLNVESVGAPEDSSFVVAAHYKGESLLRHTTHGKVGSLSCHWCLLCRSETLLVDPAAALGAPLTHLEKLIADLS